MIISIDLSRFDSIYCETEYCSLREEGCDRIEIEFEKDVIAEIVNGINTLPFANERNIEVDVTDLCTISYFCDGGRVEYDPDYHRLNRVTVNKIGCLLITSQSKYNPDGDSLTVQACIN